MDVPAPSGRRDNGLHSADWGALVDLDPRLSEALLSSLASADVPAFVEPAGDLNAYTRAAQLPARPLHRLWVDPTKADTARTVVAKEVEDLSALLAEREPGATAHGFVQAVPRSAAARVLRPPLLPDPPGRSDVQPERPAPERPTSERLSPERAADDRAGDDRAGDDRAGNDRAGDDRADDRAGDDPLPADDGSPEPRPAPEPAAADDTDAVWRQIIADFGKDADGPVPPWPVSEDVEPRRPRLRPTRPEPSSDEPPRRRRTDPKPEPVAPLPDWVEPEALEDDGHYVPPPPPPVPRLAPRKLAAALTLLAGLLLMIDPGLLLQPATTGWRTFGVLLTVGGAAALVWLMRDTPPGGRDSDDGAVV
jgi:hypothetical protein